MDGCGVGAGDSDGVRGCGSGMIRLLVAFASSEGQTEKIAHHVVRRLETSQAIDRL